MNTYYITFGQVHAHKIMGVGLDKDTVLRVKAKNWTQAHGLAFALFGRRFGTVYDENDLNLGYFPKGIVDLELGPLREAVE